MVTLREIAQKASLSVSVVSRVLNRNPDPNTRVSEKTRALVEKLAKDMGYRPNRTAEFLKRGRVPAIGVFLLKEADNLIADLVFGLSAEAEADGFHLSLSFGMTAKNYKKFVDNATAATNCGIITYPYDYDSQLTDKPQIVEIMDKFRSGGGKVVLMNHHGDSGDIPSVSFDEYEGGRLAAERLLARNCRTFMFVQPYWERTDGFIETLHAHGKETSIFAGDGGGILDLVARARAVKPENRPIGVFATNDRYAVQIIPALTQAGFHIGRDALVIGYDDQPLGKDMTPSLTTIHQPFEEAGKLAVRKVINLIYANQETSVKVKPYLVVRESG